MSAFQSSGSFYSEPNPENVGAQPPAADPQAEQKPFPDNPAYRTYGDAGSFAPSPDPMPQQFQPELQTVQAPQISLPLIAAGLFALWIIFKGERR